MEAPLLIVLDQGGGEAVILLQPLHKNLLVIIVPSENIHIMSLINQLLNSRSLTGPVWSVT